MPLRRRFRIPLAGLAAATLVLAGCDRSEMTPRTLTRTPAATPAPAVQTPAAEAASASAPPIQGAATMLPSAAVLSDTYITGKIRASLMADSALSGADVSVYTDRGVVHLAGAVKSQEQAAVASAHAQREDGVMRVDNHLSVNPL